MAELRPIAILIRDSDTIVIQRVGSPDIRFAIFTGNPSHGFDRPAGLITCRVKTLVENLVEFAAIASPRNVDWLVPRIPTVAFNSLIERSYKLILNNFLGSGIVTSIRMTNKFGNSSIGVSTKNKALQVEHARLAALLPSLAMTRTSDCVVPAGASP